jgi:hypothetical protein
MSLQDQIATYRIHFGGEMTAEKAEEVVGKWRAAAKEKAPGEDVELAAPFQRHYTNFGTGLPPNVCVVLTPSEVLAFKFDPRNTKHPLDVRPGQLKKLAARWPREAVRVTQVEAGRMAFNAVFEIDEGSGAKSIQCRTPRLAVNPAAAVLIAELGGELPTS